MPNVYQGENAKTLFTRLPPELKDNQLDLLYVTDRKPEYDEEGKFGYGSDRSYSVAFGSAIVSILPEMSWEELEATSLAESREPELTLELSSLQELGRFPETPAPFVMINGEPAPDPASQVQALKTRDAFRAELRRRLAFAPSPEVLLFVHGFNNSFEYSALTLAETWHFMGRELVPIIYTWPAGKGGAAGYIYDRESGEFTVHHLKNLIRELSAMPEIETFYLLAHSRGTDVLTSAIRELVLVSRGLGPEQARPYRDAHVILAAPDLDMDVVSQRIIAEGLGQATESITIYSSQTDKAISLAEAFFQSPLRVGRLSAERLDSDDLSSLGNLDNISIIELLAPDEAGIGHGYFHNDPSAASDLIMAVRYDMEPGEANGRPLTPVVTNFWQINPGYPHYGRSED